MAGSDNWLSHIELDKVFALLRDNGAAEVLFKVLPQNANSKNQVYIAKDFSQLGKIPMGDVEDYPSTSEKNGGARAVFRASIDLQWIDEHGQPHRAPGAQLIYYPQYPEVRISGFLRGCREAPSSLWTKEKRGTESGRILVLGLGHGKTILGITLPPESPAAKAIMADGPYNPYSSADDKHGVLYMLPMPGEKAANSFQKLMRRLCEIHRKLWVPGQRINKHGQIVSCQASNCNGNTLEAQLGIQSNGYALPDFLGWEIKARNVPNVERPGSSVITLMTPEPTEGVYVDAGLEAFLRQYGYPDTRGRPDRFNFGGIYRAGREAHDRTHVKMVLDGFNPDTEQYDPAGAIRLIDQRGHEAMAWSFTKLMDHWKVKHAHAAFVPSQPRKNPELEYRFGVDIIIGEGASFTRFLKAIHDGKIYYDPGIKVEDASTGNPTTKRRSQFRVKSKDIPVLYDKVGVVNACGVANVNRP